MIDCTPQQLVANSNCILASTSNQQRQAIQTYLLAQIAGNTMTPSELADAARCYQMCIPQGLQRAVQIYLLCQILNR